MEIHGDRVTAKRVIVYAALALAIACTGQALWSTLFNPLVWRLTYLGVHLSRAIHEPNYDSAVSARVFSMLAIVFNAVIYFAVLLVLDRLVARRKARKVL